MASGGFRVIEEENLREDNEVEGINAAAGLNASPLEPVRASPLFLTRSESSSPGRRNMIGQFARKLSHSLSSRTLSAHLHSNSGGNGSEASDEDGGMRLNMGSAWGAVRKVADTVGRHTPLSGVIEMGRLLTGVPKDDEEEEEIERRSEGKEMKSRLYELFQQLDDNKLRNISLYMLAVVGVSLCLVIAMFQVGWDTPKVDEDTGDVSGGWDKDLTAMNTLKTVLMATSVWLAVLQYYYYKTMFKRKKEKRWMYTSSRWAYLAELSIVLMHPIPFVDGSEKVAVFCFLRLYVLLRVVFLHSEVFRGRMDIGRFFQTWTVDWLFSLKSAFYNRSLTMVFALVGLFLFPLAFVTFVLERDQNESLQTYKDSMWFTYITMTTVGYGDISPAGEYGRFVAFLSALVGIVLTSLVVAVITNGLTLSNQNQYVVNYLIKDKLLEQRRQVSARIIQLHFRRYMRKKEMVQGSAAVDDWRTAGMILATNATDIAMLQQIKTLHEDSKRLREEYVSFELESGDPTLEHLMGVEQMCGFLEKLIAGSVTNHRVVEEAQIQLIRSTESLFNRVMQLEPITERLAGLDTVNNSLVDVVQSMSVRVQRDAHRIQELEALAHRLCDYVEQHDPANAAKLLATPSGGGGTLNTPLDAPVTASPVAMAARRAAFRRQASALPPEYVKPKK